LRYPILTNPASWHRDHGLLLIRLGIGVSYIVLHGWFKLVGGPDFWAMHGQSMGHLGITFAPAVWGFLSAFTETFGALLLALGLLFRPAAALLAANMAVAVVSHLVLGEGWYGAAHALHMGTVFLGLLFTGPGRFSLDAWLWRRRITAAGPLQG
jgi:putative oxidoreductase